MKNFNKLYIFLIIMLLFVDIPVLNADEIDIEKINLPSVNSFVLKNGAKVFYIKDDLPQITIVASVGFSQLYEKKNNAGISSLIAKTLILAGSKKYPGEKFHEKIDSMGGKIIIDSSWESTVISIKVLKRFKNEAFDIVTDLLCNPNFDVKYLDSAKGLLLEEIKRKYDNPADIAVYKAREIIFDGNGYGAFPTEEKIKSYSMDMVKDTWNRYFKAKNMLIGISTSIDFSEIKSDSNKNFSKLDAGEKRDYDVDINKIKDVIKGNNNKVFLYTKNIPQSTIVVGTIAPGINYKGKYALVVMNYILGGGSFNSRLVTEIRVKRGLAYSVMSVIRFRYKTGLFLAFAQTKNDTVDTVLSLILDNINRISNKKDFQDELNWSKNSIKNSYIFNFDSALNLLSNYIDMEYNNLPKDYFTKYISNINNVKDDDLIYESKQLFGNGLIKVVVGKEELKERLKKYGEVVIIK